MSTNDIPGYNPTQIQAKPLTDQQHSFVINYIKNGFNVKQAAIDAGYSEGFAHSGQVYNLLNSDKIQARLQAAHEASEYKIYATYDWKIKRLVDLIEYHSRNPSTYDSPIVIKAIAELNKMQGDYQGHKLTSVTIDATRDALEHTKKQYDRY
jgi:hypothetical protein